MQTSLNRNERTMSRAAVTVLLFLLTGLVAGCGPKDKGAADGKNPDGGAAQPKSDSKNKSSAEDSKAKGGAVTQAPSPDEGAKLKQPKADGKNQDKALPTKQITLTPEQKAVYTHVTQYGGRLFADGTNADSPIVAVRAFGFGKDLSKLKELTALEHLDLREKLSPQADPKFDATALSQFKGLKTLALDVASPNDLSSLTGLEALETLSFEVNVGGKRPKGVTINDTLQASLAEVAKIKSLKHLRVGNGGASFGSHSSDFAAIPSCPNLTYLESWVVCDDAALATIGKSQSLKKLVVVFPKGVSGKATFSTKGLSALAAAPNLSSVQLNDADDALCEAVAGLPTLKELIVGGSVTKSAIGRVAAKHPNLRLISYREAFKPPFAEPRDNWMQVLPPNRWRQVMFSKKTGAFLLGPIETNNTENTSMERLDRKGSGITNGFDPSRDHHYVRPTQHFPLRSRQCHAAFRHWLLSWH